MSELHVQLSKIDEIIKTEGSDRLFSYRIKGFWLISSGIEVNGEIVPKNKVNDLVIYVPTDVILDEKLESFLFPPDSKIKLENHRIKVLKIRKAVSMGLPIEITPELLDLYPDLAGKKEGDDVAEILGIKKYEPPLSALPRHMYTVSKKLKNFHFVEYTDIDNIKFYPTIFEDGEPVYVSIKRHGTSARYAWHPTTYDKWWKKVLKFFNLMPAYEFCIGSRRCQIHLKGYDNGYYSSDVYTKMAVQYNLKKKLKNNEQLFCEIIGSGIQGDYTYSCKQGEQKLEAYDVQVNGRYLDSEDFLNFCKERGIPTVPLAYIGPYDRDKIEPLRRGDDPDQKIREGIVIKPKCEKNHPYVGRMVFKWLNDDYLTQKNLTEFH